MDGRGPRQRAKASCGSCLTSAVRHQGLLHPPSDSLLDALLHVQFGRRERDNEWSCQWPSWHEPCRNARRAPRNGPPRNGPPRTGGGVEGREWTAVGRRRRGDSSHSRTRLTLSLVRIHSSMRKLQFPRVLLSTTRAPVISSSSSRVSPIMPRHRFSHSWSNCGGRRRGCEGSAMMRTLCVSSAPHRRCWLGGS